MLAPASSSGCGVRGRRPGCADSRPARPAAHSHPLQPPPRTASARSRQTGERPTAPNRGNGPHQLGLTPRPEARARARAAGAPRPGGDALGVDQAAEGRPDARQAPLGLELPHPLGAQLEAPPRLGGSQPVPIDHRASRAREKARARLGARAGLTSAVVVRLSGVLYHLSGRTKDANRATGQVRQVMDVAENQGCFWIH